MNYQNSRKTEKVNELNCVSGSRNSVRDRRTGRREAHTLDGTQKDTLCELIARLLASRQEIGFAYVYGSFLDSVPFHDIDVAVYLANDAQNSKTFLLGVDMAMELQSSIHLPVDVRVINDAPVSFLFSIIKGRLLFDRVPEIRNRLVDVVIQRYLDIKPILARAAKEAFA